MFCLQQAVVHLKLSVLYVRFHHLERSKDSDKSNANKALLSSDLHKELISALEIPHNVSLATEVTTYPCNTLHVTRLNVTNRQ